MAPSCGSSSCLRCSCWWCMAPSSGASARYISHLRTPVEQVCLESEHVHVHIRHPKFQPVGPLAAGLAIYAAIESGGERERPAVSCHIPNTDCSRNNKGQIRLTHPPLQAHTLVLSSTQLVSSVGFSSQHAHVAALCPARKQQPFHTVAPSCVVHALSTQLQEALWCFSAGGAASGARSFKLHADCACTASSANCSICQPEKHVGQQMLSSRCCPLMSISICRFYIIGELLAAFIVAGFATTYWGAGELRRSLLPNAAFDTLCTHLAGDYCWIFEYGTCGGVQARRTPRTETSCMTGPAAACQRASCPSLMPEVRMHTTRWSSKATL